jgi:hypothetical protein
MSLVVDEGMTPPLGFSASSRAYLLSTHLRGFAAHLAFGLGRGAALARACDTLVTDRRQICAKWTL